MCSYRLKFDIKFSCVFSLPRNKNLKNSKGILLFIFQYGASPVAWLMKNLLAVEETPV